ncbi:MAG: hypothetical protein ACAH88_00560 [Roseimicrobium sp.]
MPPRILFVLLLLLLPRLCPAAPFELATFTVDVTIPLGHPCMGGGIAPASKVIQPLQARGFVLTGAEKPFVVVCFDWCEIRGSAFEDWRKGLAEECGTDPQRVLITSTHVHDAPVMDPEAEHLLQETEKSGAWKSLAAPEAKARIQLASVCWPDFNRLCIQRARVALKEALLKKRPVTHFGIGRAQVKEVASNRRYLTPDGKVLYNRMSRTVDPVARDADAGEIDPWLRTLSLWDGDTPLCALHSYAVHPMSYYGSGEISIDFVGLARERMQQEHPAVHQMYASGCSGNVTAGKWNDGAPGTREALAGKIHAAMQEAWKETKKLPLEKAGLQLAKIPLGARNSIGFTEDALRHRMANDAGPFARAEAAMGLAWYERVKAGHRIDLPVMDLGAAQLMLLPAESYVEFQLYAQELRPDSFVMVMGYGECGPGYIPIERAWQERDSNLRDWAWVPPGSEEIMKKAIREVMKR